ncbi:unnamed protein product [Calypogeia fissa]
MKFSASVLLLGIVGLLQLGSREVGAQSPAPGPLGHAATSLCAELIEPNGYECQEYDNSLKSSVHNCQMSQCIAGL